MSDLNSHTVEARRRLSRARVRRESVKFLAGRAGRGARKEGGREGRKEGRARGILGVAEEERGDARGGGCVRRERVSERAARRRNGRDCLT